MIQVVSTASGQPQWCPSGRTPYRLCPTNHQPQFARPIFSSIFARRKKFKRYQAVPGGLIRTVSGPTRPAGPLQALKLAREPEPVERPASRRLPFATPEGAWGEGWCPSGRTEGERHFAYQPSTPQPPTIFPQVPLRGNIRQYPAIPGNMRTLAQFLAAYCRLSVRLLPRNPILLPRKTA
jgi:hypothetical protein